MKIRDIYNVLLDNYYKISVEQKAINPNADQYKLEDIQPALSALKNIAELEIFDSINKFKQEFNPFYTWSEHAYSSTNTITIKIKSSLDRIREEVESVIHALEKFLPTDEGYIISVRLPQYETLDKLPLFYKNLDLTFKLFQNHAMNNDNLKIYSFENGSKWNDFLVKNEAVFMLTMTFLATGTSLYKDITDIIKSQESVQQVSQNIQSDINFDNNLNKVFELAKEQKYDQYVLAFEETIEREKITIDNKGKTPSEIRETIKHSFKSYVKLLDEGTEFYGSVNKDEESKVEVISKVKELSSAQKQLKELKQSVLTTNTTKQLGDSHDDNPDIIENKETDTDSTD